MNIVEQAENLVEMRVARAEIQAVVWHATYFNDTARRLGPVERSELAAKVADFAADAMRDALLIAQSAPKEDK